jgi:capsular exopolysaccharide synthesis family protein
MSRIHEALRKAELERGGTAPTETPSAAFQPHISSAAPVETPASQFRPFANVEAPDRNGKSAVAAGVLTETKDMPAAQEEGVLQLSDILERCAHPNWRLEPATNVFLDPALTVDGAEQFRTLRSRLYQIGKDQSLQTLVITSALPGEGKTFVTSNLGQAIVRQHERRALIIDGDLRRSRLHLALRAPTSPGLSDYLRGDAQLLSVIQQGLGGNLCFIPGGSPVTNPSELLANGRLKILLERVAGAFDWILIDSPPCLPVADASILADLCDGVLFVVRARSTPAAVVEKAGRALQGRNVVGVVMNAVEEHAHGYHSPYGTTYYDTAPVGAKD